MVQQAGPPGKALVSVFPEEPLGPEASVSVLPAGLPVKEPGPVFPRVGPPWKEQVSQGLSQV